MAMNAFDDAMLSLALREEIPTIRFYDDSSSRWEPREQWYETMAEIDGIPGVVVAPDRTWEPLLMPGGSDRTYYIQADQPNLYIRYIRTNWCWRARFADGALLDQPPVTTNDNNTHLSTQYRRNDETQKLFLSKVWRAVRRVATNRYKDVGTEGFVATKDALRRQCWIGQSLLQWCRGDSRRAVAGIHRPCDDWEPPADPWYRSAAEKVRMLYANDLTEPPPPIYWNPEFYRRQLLEWSPGNTSRHRFGDLPDPSAIVDRPAGRLVAIRRDATG